MNRESFIVATMVALFFMNVPIYLYLGKRFFADWKGFREAVRDSFSQSPFSILLEWEVHGDLWTSLKLWIYVLLCAGVLALEYVVVFLLLLRWGPFK